MNARKVRFQFSVEGDTRQRQWQSTENGNFLNVDFGREIWSLQGPFFSLPLADEWPGGQTELAAVRIGGGIRLLDVQIRTAEARLLAIGAVYEQRGENGKRWWIAREKLEQFCNPEGKVDPESVVEWRPVERVRYSSRKRLRVRRKSADEFFHEFCKMGWIRNPAKAEILYVAFCKFMLHWLVNEQKPVDLGFCRLVPLPLRANWKSLLLSKHRGRADLPDPHSISFVEEIASEVLKGEYTAWNFKRPVRWRHKPRHIFWSLEVLPGPSWWRATMYGERKRRHRDFRLKGIEQYCGGVKQAILRALPWISKLYASYLAQVKNPGARLSSERTATGKISKAARERRGNGIRVDPADVVSAAYDYRDPTPVPLVEFGTPEQTDSRLRAMPDLPPEVEDMRQSRISVDQPENEANGNHGVHVPDGRSGACEV